jgi:hypothetical protein
MGDLLPLVIRDDVIRGEVALDVDAEAAPFFLFDFFRDLGC